MALVINEEECVSCSVCADECPNDAISRGEDSFVIDPNLCTECADIQNQHRCVEVCPIDCIRTSLSQKKESGGLYQKFLRILS